MRLYRVEFSHGLGPSLQIAAIGVGSRFGGTADVHSGSITLQPLPDFDLDPQPPYFAARKKCARPLTSERKIIRVFLTLCSEYNAQPTTGTGCLVVKQPFNVETFLATVNGGRSISKYRKNQTVFRQGELADSVFFIEEGKVKVSVVSEQGKEAVVAIHGKGDFFGEGCLTGQPRRLATVTSMTECVIMRLDKATIVRVIHDEPKFSEMFMSFLLARNARVEEGTWSINFSIRARSVWRGCFS